MSDTINITLDMDEACCIIQALSCEANDTGKMLDSEDIYRYQELMGVYSDYKRECEHLVKRIDEKLNEIISVPKGGDCYGV